MDITFTADKTDKVFELWVLLHQASHALARAREKELSQYGISVMESSVLFFVGALREKPTPAQISRLIFREHQTVTSLLRRMEKKGLVTKAKDLDRQNLWRVALTEKGQIAYHQSLQRESIHTVMSGLSENEQQQFKSFLKEVRDQALKYGVREPVLPFP